MNLSFPYLHIPVKNGAEKVVFRFSRAGKLVREFDVQLAQDGVPDWWAFYDVSDLGGQPLEVTTEPALRIPLEQALRQADDLPQMPDLYNEACRPQFHFTAMRGWNNDPNGLVYHDGVWHMYYQHNPFGVAWGNMHWGHATSSDLIHWQEQPEALYQRSLADMAFSGGGFIYPPAGASIDDSLPAGIFVAFTSTGRGECLAYSTNGGRTLTEVGFNPFLVHHGRDPKLLWYAPEKKWLLVLYDELDPADTSPEKRGYAFYDSPDLREWRRLSFQPGWWECPEFFELPLDSRMRWVLYGGRWDAEKPAGLGSRSAFQVGDFDGTTFTPTSALATGHHGPHFYAAQCFSNAPDGRVIMIGWMAGANYPGMPFSGGMIVPLELTLRQLEDGPHLCFHPAREVEMLRGGGIPVQTSPAANGEPLPVAVPAGEELLDLDLSLTATGPVTLDLRGNMLAYDPASGVISFAGEQAGLAPSASLALRVLIDRCVTEVFAQGGLAAFSAMTPDNGPEKPVTLRGAAVEGMVYPMQGIW